MIMYDSRFFVCLFVCLFPMQIGTAARNASKCSAPADEAM